MLSHKVEEQVQKKSALIKEFLEKEVISQDSRLQLRGIGMIWGVEFENIPIVGLADRVIEQCFSHGLIIEGAGRKNSVVKLMPPLVISEEDLLAGMQIIKQSVQEVLATI